MPEQAQGAESWVARTRGGLQARAAAKLVIFAPLAMAVGVLTGGIARLEVVALVVVAALSWGAGAWLWLVGRRTVEIALDGKRLTIAGRGSHELGRGSLHAARWASSASAASTGSVVFVRLGAGEVVALAIPSMLPDASYASDASTAGELFVEPDAHAARLLGQLQPFVMPRNPSAPPEVSAGHSILLRGSPARRITIAGDTVTVADGATGQELASAAASAVAATLYRYAHAVRDFAPMPACPALLITFPASGLTLSIGAPAPDLEERWLQLPKGPRPDFEVGFAELAKLIDVLAPPPGG
jgi:hypothetical protein